MARRSAVALVLVFLSAACSSEDPSTSASAESEAPNASSTASSVEPAGSQPAATASAGPCTPPTLCGEELTPGEYSATTSETLTTFTVGEGWRDTEYPDLGFDLVMLDDGVPQLMSGVPYAGVVYADVCSGDGTEEIGAAAADFIAFVSDRPGITPRADATDVTIGGLSGLQVDVDASDPGCVSDPPDRLWLWDVAGVTDFHLNVGEAARLIALDGESGVIVLVIETFDPSTFDALLESLQPVLDSMTFG